MAKSGGGKSHQVRSVHSRNMVERSGGASYAQFSPPRKSRHSSCVYFYELVVFGYFSFEIVIVVYNFSKFVLVLLSKLFVSIFG